LLCLRADRRAERDMSDADVGTTSDVSSLSPRASPDAVRVRVPPAAAVSPMMRCDGWNGSLAGRAAVRHRSQTKYGRKRRWRYADRLLPTAALHPLVFRRKGSNESPWFSARGAVGSGGGDNIGHDTTHSLTTVLAFGVCFRASNRQLTGSTAHRHELPI